ncbi:MAG: amidohydrolase [Chloroflexota bacterium]|nr:amidohydrolase [Chloroflexota bacterium]
MTVERAGLILAGGPVVTCDRRRPTAEAVGVRDGRIVSVGEAAAVRAALGPDSRGIDLAGRTLVPGFIDAHNHFLSTAESFSAIDARDPSVHSTADLMALVDAAAERTEPGRWVRGFGMDFTRFPDGQPPTRWDLDEVTREHPVVILHVSGHYALVNSRALEARGIGDDVRDPVGGSFERDDAGRPTGLLRDTATNLVLQLSVDIGNHGPNFHTAVPLDDLVALLDEAAPRYLAAGLTSICDPQVTSRELTAYREARRRGVLRVRTTCLPLSSQLDEYEAIGLTGPFGDDQLRIGGMKFYTDGAITGGTAAFSRPIGAQGQHAGTLYHEPAELRDLLVRAAADGWQLAIHTMGDRAMGIMLDGVEAARGSRGDADHRDRIEHCTWPTPEQIGRIGRLGMIPVTQPGSIAELGDIWRQQLGDRIERANPLREELAAGIPVVISSDAFVQSYRPLDTIAAAVRRVTPSGVRVGADQELTIEEALAAHTINAARALRMDDRIGSIEEGKLADLAVIDGDLLATSPDRVRELGIWMTILGGEVVHRA